MFRSLLLSIILTASSTAYAACYLDSPEIGDIGPGSELVCDMLETRSQNSSITILDRMPKSNKAVSILVDVDGEKQSLNYRLVGANWRLEDQVTAGIK